MIDLITTILTTAIEHAPSTTAVVAAYKAAQPFLAKILGPGAEELGEIGRDYIKERRAKNVERTLAGADKMLTEAGREPQEVPLNIVIPLLDAASLQDEPSLVHKWVALLANAADPAQRVQIQPGFVEVLRQLTPDDAQVLAFIYTEWGMPDDNELFGEDSTLVIATVFSRFEWSGDRIEVSLDNLLRMRLYEEFRPVTYGAVPEREHSQILLTAYGAQFMRVVTPPAPEVVE